jgi:pimeloyl-ACP methyl ester carboxylesterase
MFTGAGLDDSRIDDYVMPLLARGALTGALSWYRATPVAELTALGPINQATTYVWSDRDMAIDRTAATGCAAHVAGPYRFVELAGVTHWIADQAPGALADAILDRILPPYRPLR